MKYFKWKEIEYHIGFRFPPMIWFGIMGLAFAMWRFHNFIHFQIDDSADLFITIYMVGGFFKFWKRYPNTICGCCEQKIE